jgi:hypothetical protein
MLKTALIFVVCLDNHFQREPPKGEGGNSPINQDNHFQVQELTDYLPGSYKTEEIFHIGITRALKIRAGFYTREG